MELGWGKEVKHKTARIKPTLAGWCKHKAPKWEADFSSRFNSYLSLIIALDVLEFAAKKEAFDQIIVCLLS